MKITSFLLRLLPVFVLVLGLAVTFLLYKVALKDARRALHNEFNIQVQEITNGVQQRMDAYEQVLRGANGLFSASASVERNEFRDYVATLRLDKYYPGIQGVGFALIIPPSEKAKHIQSQRQQGRVGYTIYPDGEREIYTSIVYLEPNYGRNLRAIGFDMYSEAVRREAMQRARDQGVAALSGKVTLVQETNHEIQPGFLLYIPVYRNGSVHDSLESRRANIIGWVYSPFRMYDLMTGLMNKPLTDIDFMIFDGVQTATDRLMYDVDNSELSGEPDASLYRTNRLLNIAGHAWTLKMRSLPAFEARFDSRRAILIQRSGFLLSVLLSLTTWLLVNGRKRLISIAEQMTQDLRESEFRWKFALEGAGEGLWDWNMLTNSVFFTTRWKAMLGYAENEIGSDLDEWASRVHPDDQANVRAAVQAHLDGHTPIYTCEHRVRCKDASWKWILDRGMVVSRAADGKPLRMIGTHTDITERKLIEAAIKESHENLLHMLEVSPIAVRISAADGRKVLFANRRYIELINADAQGVIGADPSAYYANQQDYQDILKQLANGEAVTDRLLELRIPDANSHQLADHPAYKTTWTLASYLRMNYQGELAILGWFYDVTELRHAKEAAEDAAKIKSEFLANMSHEIRTPMNAILGLTHLALNKNISAEVRDYLEKISSASNSLLGILNDILDLSKIEAGRMSIQHSIFDLDTVVTNLNNLFAAQAEEKYLDFEISVAADVPPSLVGDALRLQQVLINLLSNAIKFTERGKVALHISLKQQDQSQVRLLFSVVDSGVGMSAKERTKLFQPFSQVDGSISRRFGGTGLGLAISHNLLHLMGSEFSVESAPGKGSTFSFELTLGLSPQAGQRKAATSVIAAQDAEKPLLGFRVLVAEDNIINQQVVTEFLCLSGASATQANNGKEALALLQQQAFDAVLMDVHMPEMGGIEATQLIRKQQRFAQLPIIALTAGVTDEEQETCLAAGMNDFISKPVRPDILVARLRQWVQPVAAAIATTDRSLSEVEAKFGSGSGFDSAQPAVNSAQSAISAAQVADVLQEQPVKAIALDNLPGMDLRNLLEMFGNNQQRVLQLLLDFKEDIQSLSAEIEAMLASGNRAAARELAHKLKGAAGNIGAVGLHAAAGALEAELKDGRLDDAVLSAFQAEFNQVMSIIAGIQPQQQAVQAPFSGNVEALKCAIAELDVLLENGDFIPETILHAFKANLPSEQLDWFGRLHKQIKNIQYGDARQLLRQLLEQLAAQESR